MMTQVADVLSHDETPTCESGEKLDLTRSAQKIADIIDRAPQPILNHLARHPRVVRREHDVRQREQLIVRRQRLLMKNVERGTRKSAMP